MCFNKRVIAGVAVVGLGTLALAPHVFSRVLPLLLVAACPLSMVFMMRGINSKNAKGSCSMSGNQRSEDQQPTTTTKSQPAASIGADQAGLQELREQVSLLRAELAHRQDTPSA